MWGVVLGRRYRVAEPLGHGGMGSVYRAYDRLRGEWVALKRISRRYQDATVRALRTGTTETMATLLSPGQAAAVREPRPAAPDPDPTTEIPTELDDEDDLFTAELTRRAARAVVREPGPHSTTRFRLALAHEFRTLASLHHPNIIRVLDCGFDEEQLPFFTMELLPAARSFRQAGEGRSLDARVQLVAQLLRALAYLHRHGVLHRDLKPSNVLCVGDVVKVLDFGVATPVAGIRDIAGTVDYMAPEVLLGVPPTAASDLYAVGVMAYELLVGEYPFDRSEQSRLLREILGPEADRPLPLHVRRLLASTRSMQASPESPEPEAVRPAEPRERARWDGLRTLPPALRAYLRRLLSRDADGRFGTAEHALAALAEAAGTPLPVDTETTRESHLRAARLVGRDAELQALSAAMDAAQAGQGGLILLGGESGVGKTRILDEARVIAMVRGMIVLGGSTAESGGAAYQVFLEPLRPLCLYGAIGDAEAAVLRPLLPGLPALLGRAIGDAPVLDPQATQSRLRGTIESVLLHQDAPILLALEDLHHADTESVALLGRVALEARTRPVLILATYRDDERPRLPEELPHARLLRVPRLPAAAIEQLCAQMLGDAAHRPEVLRLLERESEGNVFLLVEAARALAERLRAGGRADAAGLAQGLLTDRMAALLQRRLQRLPAAALPTLRLAALWGRELDLRLLAELEPGLGRWLRVCEEAAVVTLHQGRWQFAHDKLREAVLSSLPPPGSDARRALHRQVAEALERACGEAPAAAAALARHWSAADVPARAVRHARRAAEQALSTGAIQDAIEHLERTRALQARLGPGALDRLERAQVLRLLATALCSCGRLKECAAVLEEASALLGTPVPRGALEYVRALAPEVARFVRARLDPGGGPGARRAEADPEAAEQLALLRGAGEVYFWMSEPGKIVLANLRGLNLAEALGERATAALYSGVLGFVLDRAGRSRLSQYFLRSAAALIPGADPATLLSYLRLLGSLHMEHGRMEAALDAYGRATELARSVGDEASVLFGMHAQACLCFVWGDDTGAQTGLASLYSGAERAGNAVYRVWSRGVQGAIFLRQRRLPEARTLLDEAEALARAELDAVARCFVLATRARCLLVQGEADAAWTLAREASALAATIRLPTLMMLEAYAALIESGLALDAAGYLYGRPLVELIRTNLRALHGAARLAEPWQARAATLAGRWALQRGLGPLARAPLERGLRTATRFGLRFDQGLAHAALARLWRGSWHPGDAASRSEAAHRDAARLLFTQCGARLYLDEIDGPDGPQGAGGTPAGP